MKCKRLNTVYVIYEDRPINKTQNGIILLIFEVWKVRDNFLYIISLNTYAEIFSLLWRHMYIERSQSVQYFAH